ncbi:MAG: ABC transporter permease subunit [Verrucomicrobiota bacterium]
MTNTLSIYKRELGAFFTQVTAYAVIIIFLLLSTGLAFTFGGFFDFGDASLEFSFFRWHPWLFMLFAPAIGMGLWADEQRNGTIELLGTLPTSTWSAILGKFLAGATVGLIALALTFPIWWTVNSLGNPDNLTIFSGYLGSFLVFATFLAITMLISAFTKNQLVCLIISAFFCVAISLIGYDAAVIQIGKISPDWLTETLVSLGVWDHFRSLMRGAFRLQDFVWFFSIIAASLLGTSAILSARRS